VFVAIWARSLHSPLNLYCIQKTILWTAEAVVWIGGELLEAGVGFWKDTMLLEMMRNTSNRIGHDDEDVDERSHNWLMKASRPQACAQVVSFDLCCACFVETL
jgi:hypothetical protein